LRNQRSGDPFNSATVLAHQSTTSLPQQRLVQLKRRTCFAMIARSAASLPSMASPKKILSASCPGAAAVLASKLYNTGKFILQNW